MYKKNTEKSSKFKGDHGKVPEIARFANRKVIHDDGEREDDDTRQDDQDRDECSDVTGVTFLTAHVRLVTLRARVVLPFVAVLREAGC